MSYSQNMFRHSALALGLATAVGLPTGAIAQDEPTLEEVTVVGIRASVRASVDVKRDAGSIVDAITSTDIGKLPDVTIADSLQRITGVQVQRDAGEGSSVNIRGNGSVMTTLNGEVMLAAGSITNVQANFADIPSTMVSGMEVMKSPEARTMEGGITGTINLKTYRPLDIDKGLTISGKAEMTQGSLSKENDPTVAAFFGYNMDNRFGVTLNVSASEANLADFTTGATGDDWGFVALESASFPLGEAGVDANRDDLSVAMNEDSGMYEVVGTPNDRFYTYQGHEATNKLLKRDRFGLSSTFQASIGDAFEVVADVFYTSMDEQTNEASFIASNAWNTPGWVTVEDANYRPLLLEVTAEDGTALSDRTAVDGALLGSIQSGVWHAQRNMSHTEAIAIEKEALNTNIEVKFDNGGVFSGSLRYVHGEAREDQTESVADTYINNGSQAGATTYGPTTIDADGNAQVNPTGHANPWGLAGISNGGYVLNVDQNTGASDWVWQDGDGTMIPVGIAYTGSNQVWDLPLFSDAGTQLLNADGRPVFVSSAAGDRFVRDADGSLVAYAGESEVLGENRDRYSLTSSNLVGYNRHAEMDVVRFDGTLNLEYGLLTSIDFGARAASREVKQDDWTGVSLHTNNYGDAFVARWKDPGAQAPLTGESYTDTISFNDARVADAITRVDTLVGVEGIDHFYAVDPEAMKDGVAFHEDVYGPQAKLANPDKTFSFEEDTTRLFVQANFEGEIADINVPFSGNFGLRVVSTDMEINQTSVAVANSYVINGQTFLRGPGAPSVADEVLVTQRSYTDYLPAANISFDLTDDQKLRFAYSKNMANHNAEKIAGGIDVTRLIGCELRTESGETIFCASAATADGNPQLDPTRSTNWEAAWEWYFSDVGMLNVGYFQYEIQNPLEGGVVERDDIADSDGVVRGWVVEGVDEFKGTVTTRVESNGVTPVMIEGWEVGYQQSIDDFLEDSLLSGLGWQLNYTYSPSSSSKFDYYGTALPAVNNSEQVYNAVLWYENHGFEGRLAYNYRSERYISQRTLGGITMAKMTDGVGYLDASLRYSGLDVVTLSLQATNIMEEGYEEYYQWSDLIDKRFYNERRITFGVQAKF